jgi:hypothetical protein
MPFSFKKMYFWTKNEFLRKKKGIKKFLWIKKLPIKEKSIYG